MFFTFLLWTVEFLLLVLILTGISQTPSILTVFASKVLLTVVMIVPATPGASGIAEFGAVSIFSVFINASIIGVTILAWRALTYYINLFLGGLISLKVIKDIDLIKKLIQDPDDLFKNNLTCVLYVHIPVIFIPYC